MDSGHFKSKKTDRNNGKLEEGKKKIIQGLDTGGFLGPEEK